MLNRDLRLLYIAIFLFGFGFGLYIFLYPLYAKELGASPVQIGLIYALFNIWMTCAFLPGGFLADRFDLRKIMIFTWWLAVPGVVVYLIARSWPLLIIGDLFVALSLINGPASQAYIKLKAPPGREQWIFTLVYGSSFALGMVLSPTLGGYIGQVWGLRSIFYFTFFLYLSSAALVFLLTPARLKRTPPRVGLRTVFKDRRFREQALYFSALFFAYYICFPFVAPFLKSAKGLDFSQIGFLGAVASLGAATLAPLLAYLADRWGRRRALMMLIMLFIISLVLMLGFNRLALLVLAFFLFGVMDGARALTLAFISQTMERMSLGLALGMFNTVRSGASFPGPYIGGFLFEHASWLPFAVVAMLMVLLLAGAFFLGSNHHAPPIPRRPDSPG